MALQLDGIAAAFYQVVDFMMLSLIARKTEGCCPMCGVWVPFSCPRLFWDGQNDVISAGLAWAKKFLKALCEGKRRVEINMVHEKHRGERGSNSLESGIDL